MRETQLVNAMKYMDIGDIRPKKVIDIEDDKHKVLSSPVMQTSGSQVQDQNDDGVSSSHVAQPNV